MRSFGKCNDLAWWGIAGFLKMTRTIVCKSPFKTCSFIKKIFLLAFLQWKWSKWTQNKNKPWNFKGEPVEGTPYFSADFCVSAFGMPIFPSTECIYSFWKCTSGKVWLPLNRKTHLQLKYFVIYCKSSLKFTAEHTNSLLIFISTQICTYLLSLRRKAYFFFRH